MLIQNSPPSETTFQKKERLNKDYFHTYKSWKISLAALQEKLKEIFQTQEKSQDIESRKLIELPEEID